MGFEVPLPPWSSPGVQDFFGLPGASKVQAQGKAKKRLRCKNGMAVLSEKAVERIDMIISRFPIGCSISLIINRSLMTIGAY